MDQTDPSFNLL